VIYRVMVKMDLEPLVRPKASTNFFAKLCREIITQQLASEAATAIRNRFSDLFPNKEIVPKRVLARTDQELRDVGMSWAKVSYIKDLAQKTKNKEIVLEKLVDLDDETVVLELTKVKGIGRWTAEMFLMFTLGREDVFSHGDLGLKKAIMELYGFQNAPTEAEVDEIVKRWSPYKTYGCLALWRLFD
jgi:DNA-3-methyladenine glycosylase II